MTSSSLLQRHRQLIRDAVSGVLKSDFARSGKKKFFFPNTYITYKHRYKNRTVDGGLYDNEGPME